LAAYPDYQPGGGGVATSSSVSAPCKIELSVFENASGTPLTDWIPVHLRQDPTLAIEQVSLESRMAGNAPVIIWRGTIDGTEAVLAYLAGKLNIYEVAPSSLDPQATSSEPCLGYLDEFLNGLRIAGV